MAPRFPQGWCSSSSDGGAEEERHRGNACECEQLDEFKDAAVVGAHGGHVVEVSDEEDSQVGVIAEVECHGVDGCGEDCG